MPIDARRYALTPEGRNAERLADLERHASQQDRGSLNRATATAQVTVGGSVTVPNNVGVTISTFSSVMWDTGGMFTAGQPDRLTAPVGGVYLCVAQVQFSAGGGTGFRNISFTGTGINFGLSEGESDTTSGTQIANLTKVEPILLATGGFVQLFAFISAVSNGTLADAALSLTFVGAV